MKTTLLNYKKISSLILGTIAVGGLPPYYHFYLLFFSFTGLLLLINNAEKPKQAFACGYWFGFGFFSIGFSWIGNALLIDAATTGWLYPITLLSSGLFFGLFTALPAYLSFKYFKGIYQRYIAFGCLWTLFEWLRSFILTGFPWNLLGSVLAFDIKYVQLADIFGTYGLSLLVLLMCGAPALLISQRNFKSAITCFIFLFTTPIVIFYYGTIKLNNNNTLEKSEIKIRIVQPSIPQKMKWDEKSLKNNFDEYIRISKSENLEDIDFTIWGETASPFPLDMEPLYLQKSTEAISKKGYLVTGSIKYEYNFSEGMYQPANALMVINNEGKILDSYDKSHLVPFGEYIPLKKFLPSWIKPVTNVVANFKQGNGNKSIKIGEHPSFGGLICYEIIFPSQIVDKSNRPRWLINITNDGWYGVSSGPYQHLVTTQLRAVEEGLTIVRVANSGISALISSNGEVLEQILLNKKEFLDTFLPRNLDIKTLYSIYGNCLIVTLCLSILTLMIMWCKLKRKF
ncbi:MAG: apolipoprotein N-acyltransferase [Alphaproteobacteria bacterium]